jgi:hypothetical protein
MHFFSLLTWATSFANIIPLDLISLVICGKEYKHEVPPYVTSTFNHPRLKYCLQHYNLKYSVPTFVPCCESPRLTPM